ncbi:hypothetical protein CR513_01292, partial [Mucuna pruriens]
MLPRGSDRSSSNTLYDLDHDIELTLQRLRKVRSTIVSTNNSPNSSSNSDNSVSTANNIDSSSYSITPTLSWICLISITGANGEPRSHIEGVGYVGCGVPTMVHRVSAAGADLDPHKYLKEFHVVCSMMRPQGIPEDYIKMKAFPFSLDEAKKD